MSKGGEIRKRDKGIEKKGRYLKENP